MSAMIPNYIESRIRREVPLNSFVVAGSTPVIAFGNAQTARVATLGLNPSRQEFLDTHGRELSATERRFETLTSLGVTSLRAAPSLTIQRVWEACNRYFNHKPYWRWFGQLEPILNAIGASYLNGSACHLDLVQWATDPTWARLPSTVRNRLIEEDAHFLRQQLEHEHIGVLLLNGTAVVNAFGAAFPAQLTRSERTVAEGTVTTHFTTGRGPHGIRVIGWSTNLQSSFGVSTVLRRGIAEEVARLARTAA